MTPARKVALVTGAGSGIGEATTQVLLSDGWHVMGVDRAWAPGGQPETDTFRRFQGDITREDVNTAAVAATLAAFGQLDGLVLNAGVALTGTLETQPLDLFDTMIAVNLRAPLIGIRAALDALRASAHPAIVVTASVSGMGGDPGLSSYGAAKGGLINLIRAAAMELGHEQIRINAVCPGPVTTPINRETRETRPERAAELQSSIPLHRWGQPAEVGQAIAFLLSTKASFITGVALPVDGGVTATSGQFRPVKKAAEASHSAVA
jgi:NAD(P)-dependent dehydrogenase (short-subunit alcohol dehydrogenase family)